VFEEVSDLSYFRAIVREGCPGFVCVAFVGVSLVDFFVLYHVFVGLVYVVDFVGSYYFLQLVVLLSILFVSSEVLMGANAFW
jgi:hypothetical protein